MQSYMTQAHQRNYQGKVILQPDNQVNRTRSKRHKILNKIAITTMVLAMMVSGSLLGVMTLHNHQLKQRIQVLETQTATVTPQQTTVNYRPQRHAKKMNRIPISDQQYETQPLPAIVNEDNHA